MPIALPKKNAPAVPVKKGLVWRGPRPAQLATPLAEPDPEGRGFLLQPWMTVRGSASGANPIKSITQDDALWMDLSRFAGAAFWVDVSGVTNPSGGNVVLNLEASPTTDEQSFLPIVAPVTLASSGDANGAVVPIFVKTVRSAGTVPPARYTRWRLGTTGGTGTWDASFRIRGVGGSTRFWSPLDIAGCQLWARADMGVTLSGTNVTAWADQSGNGRNFSASGTNPPTWSGASSINGLPAISFDNALGEILTTSAFSLGVYTVAMVCTKQVGTNGFFWCRSDAGVGYDTLYGDVYCTMYVDRGTGTQSCREYTSGWGQGTAGSPPMTSSGDLVIVQFDGTASGHTLRINGTQINVTTHAGYGDPGTGANSHKFCLAGRDDGTLLAKTTVAEVIVYNAPLAANALAALEEYCRRRYALY